MKKKYFITSWAVIGLFIILFGMSCDTTKPKPPVYNYNLALSHHPSEDITYADFGISTVTLTATLTDENSAPLSGRSVIFTWPQGSVELLDTETDSNGKMRAVFQDDGYASECLDSDNIADCTDWAPLQLSATYADQYNNTASASDDIIVLPLATKVNTVNLVSDASSNNGLILVDDNNQDSLYTVTFNAFIRDDNNIAIENIDVHFEFDPEYSVAGVFSSAAVQTDNIGKATNTLVATGQELLALQAADTVKVTAYIELNELARLVERSHGKYYFADGILQRSDGQYTASQKISFRSMENWSIEQVENLIVSLNPMTILFDTTVPDSTYHATINVTLLDANAMPVANVPLNILNQIIDEDQLIGSISPTFVISDENGFASADYSISYSAWDQINSPVIRVQVMQDGEIVQLVDSVLLLRNQNEPDIDLVGNLNTWSQTSFFLVNNSNVGVSDTVYARVTDHTGGALSGIPVYYTKDSPVGYFTDSMVISDTTGLSRSVFVANPGEVPLNEDTQIEFTITVNEEYNSVENLTISPNGNVNNVAEMHFTTSVDTLNILNLGYLQVIAKDPAGVGVSNIPIRFAIDNEDGSGPKGILETALVYTTESDTSGNDPGFATVGYTVDHEGIDRVRAFISDPDDQSVILHEDLLYVSAQDNNQAVVANLVAYASSSTVSVVNNDSTYVDTLFAIAQNSSGGGIEGVVINFDMPNEDLNYGFLQPSSSIITDSIGVAKAYFQSSPGIVTDTDIRDINFTISTQDQDNNQTEYLTISFSNDIPQCPQCVAEFRVWTDPDMINLPTPEGDVSAPIYAAYVDSLGYGPEPNSIVEFVSMIDSAGVLVPFASIDPIAYFNKNYSTLNLPPGYFDSYSADSILTAQSTFYQTNDAGLAVIIGTYQGKSDTLRINITSEDAAYIVLEPTYPNEIMVQGGGGLETTEISASIHDSNGNLVSDSYNVKFIITEPYPTGTHLAGTEGLTEFVVESSNGIASTTLSAGTHPGSVNIRAELYAVDDEVMDESTLLSWAQTIMVTIITGPPYFGEINFAQQEITPIGGGNYELPLSVTLWDINSNPVKDSTNVWLTLYPFAPPFDPDTPYFAGNLVMYGTNPIDSLAYMCLFDTLTPPIPDPTDEGLWTLAQQPAFIIGEAQTGMPNPWGGGDTGNDFQGIAWSALYYTSNPIFDLTIMKAQTYYGDGQYLVIDSRSNHNGQPTMLPFQPGQIFISASPVFHDFSVGPNSNNPCRSQVITVSATLVDFYGENIDNGALQLTAIGAGLADPPPDPNWDPNWVQITNPQGQAVWYIEYPIQLCPKTDPQTCPTTDNDCTLCEYDDFNSSVWVDLIFPVQTQSNQLEVTLMRSGGECDNCP